jgi:hypothetical protein
MPVLVAENKTSVERRKHERFQLPRSSFVAVRFHDTILGQIIDLSMSGLAFRYIGKESLNGAHLDIFFIEDNFFWGDVPFVTVADFETKLLGKIVVNGIHPRRITVRRCGDNLGI